MPSLPPAPLAGAPVVQHGLDDEAGIARRIEAGHVLLLAGAEASLARLPAGRWVGGTAAQALTPQGGVTLGTDIAYTDLTAIALNATAHRLNSETLRGIGAQAPYNGFTVLILPGLSALLGQAAGELGGYEGLYNAPLIGWVSAVALDEIGRLTPKTFAGGPEPAHERAAVLYVTLPAHLFAQLHIVNLFSPGKGAAIEFPAPALAYAYASQGDCLIGGKPGNLARHMAAQAINSRLPLIANSDGAVANLAIHGCDPENGVVEFIAPALPGLTYHFAERVGDYTAAFTNAAAKLGINSAAVASVCALAYQHANLAAAPLGLFHGPVGFGQIAYTPLTQTLACLSLAPLDDGMGVA